MIKPRNLQPLPQDLQDLKNELIAQLGSDKYKSLCDELNNMLAARGFSVQQYGLSGL